MNVTREKFETMHLLPRSERQALTEAIHRERPEFLQAFFPRWWWWQRCPREVLIVTDGLSFGTTDFGLSEFLTTFNELEATSSVDYRVTTAYHRTTGTSSGNAVVVKHLDNFEFTGIDLSDFDQVWLFGIGGVGLDAAEIDAVTGYMDGGGGLFATGDHAALGNSLCGSLPRVKDMRYWADFGSGEVSMGGARRNDTNQPSGGAAASTYFNDQSDAIPQRISAHRFGSGRPHPLLSISPRLRISGVIDIMPDHPHEGECKPETTFEVNGVEVSSQTIATSFVIGGNTGGGKSATEPHCFPSIAVWDGSKANAGRVVVDSTWHHFININLTATANGPGLNTNDWNAVRQYYMNIATWMSRPRGRWCWWRHLIHALVLDSQVVEASIEAILQDPREARLSELHSIGVLTEELLSSEYNPGFSRGFILDLLSGVSPELSDALDDFSPTKPKKRSELHQPWIDLDLVLHTAVGAGIAAVRLDDRFASAGASKEEHLEAVESLFNAGAVVGIERALADLESDLRRSLGAIKVERP